MLAEENELGQMQVVKRPGLVPVASPRERRKVCASSMGPHHDF